MFDVTDFVTDDELDDLPADPGLAFRTFVTIAQKSLRALTDPLNPHADTDWERIQEARYTFMNITIAAAKQFDIPTIKDLELPRFSGFGNEEFRSFQRDLDHYLTQFLLLSRARGARESVLMTETLRESIKTHLHHLRDAISKSKLPQSKKDALFARLESFEAELSKRRLSLMEVAVLTITLASAPGGVAATSDLIQKMVHKIWTEVADAKQTEEKQLGHLSEPLKALAPPRIDLPTRPRRTPEDEIPF